MIKRVTASEVEAKVYNLVTKHVIPMGLNQGKTLSQYIQGKVYYDGGRPTNADTEDIIIAFAAGSSGQFTRGVVMINIFVPNVDFGADRGPEKDNSRIPILENVLQKFADSLPVGDYLFEQRDVIQSYPLIEQKQYYINLKLNFSYHGRNN